MIILMADSSITILQSSTVYVPNLLSYQVTLQVTNAQNIPTTIFVKQRLKSSTNQINDIFVAIATPQQLETLGVKVPTANTSFFLDSQINLVANTVEYLNSIVTSILSELQNLCTDVQLLDNLVQSSIYTITSGNIMTNTYESHTHYRLPLLAQPCGTQVVTDGVVTITSVNPDIPGWLPCSGGDPAGYYFKYNIPLDPNLPLLYPPSPDKISYARVDENGISLDDDTVLINANGIYWSNNKYEFCPWPTNFVSPSNPGGNTPDTTVILVFDFIV